MEYAYKHVSSLCDPKRSLPDRAFEMCRVGWSGVLIRKSEANLYICLLFVFICSLKFLFGDAAS